MAVRYALYALNQEYGQQVPSGEHEARFTPANTLVIAGSVSNGGAAVLRAAEQDTEALIDGVVANEPSAQPQATPGFGVQFGGNAVPTVGKPLIDYITIANLYQPCAALAPAASMSEASFYNYMVLTAMSTRAVNRCAALAARGLVAGSSAAEQAADALAKLHAYGWSAEHDTMHNAHYGLADAPHLHAVPGGDGAAAAAAADLPPEPSNGLTPPRRRGGRGRFISDVIVELGFPRASGWTRRSRRGSARARSPEQVLLEPGAITADQLARATARALRARPRRPDDLQDRPRRAQPDHRAGGPPLGAVPIGFDEPATCWWRCPTRRTCSRSTTSS